MNCTRCQGSGWLNIHQLPDDVDAYDPEAVQKWLDTTAATESAEPHDVQVCDCCGDGTGWYGVPGEHYGPEDMSGPNGPYSYNGGLCECH